MFCPTVEHGLGRVHQHPEERGGGERFVDGVGEGVAGGGRPRCDPEGGGHRGEGLRSRFVHGSGAILGGERGDSIHFITCGTKNEDELDVTYGASNMMCPTATCLGNVSTTHDMMLLCWA